MNYGYVNRATQIKSDKDVWHTSLPVVPIVGIKDFYNVEKQENPLNQDEISYRLILSTVKAGGNGVI